MSRKITPAARAALKILDSYGKHKVPVRTDGHIAAELVSRGFAKQTTDGGLVITAFGQVHLHPEYLDLPMIYEPWMFDARRYFLAVDSGSKPRKWWILRKLLSICHFDGPAVNC